MLRNGILKSAASGGAARSKAERICQEVRGSLTPTLTRTRPRPRPATLTLHPHPAPCTLILTLHPHPALCLRTAPDPSCPGRPPSGLLCSLVG
eukprot:5317821-Prymnesium_polylepis.1